MPTPKKGARLGGSAKQQAHLLSNLAASPVRARRYQDHRCEGEDASSLRRNHHQG